MKIKKRKNFQCCENSKNFQQQMKTKKAQVTPFIIIGLVILIIGSLFIYYRNFIFIEPDVISEDVLPIKNYIDACLNHVGEDAVTRLGMQGGYIFEDQVIPSEAVYPVEIMPRFPLKIPYWYYNSVSYVPSIELMQKQISDHIEVEIKNCINFDLFEEYEIEEVEDIKINTRINEEDVSVDMDYKLIIRDKSNYEETKEGISKIVKDHGNIEVLVHEMFPVLHCREQFLFVEV